MEGQVMQLLQSIGQTLGVPALIGMAWLVFVVKQLVSRVDKLEKESDLLKGTLSEMNSSLSYIKGRMENPCRIYDKEC